MILCFDFTFTQFPETTPEEREFEHEHTPHTVQNPSPSSPQPSSSQPKSRRPTAQITLQPSFHFFLSSSLTSPPSRLEPCISFLSSPPKIDLVLNLPKTNLVTAAEDQSLFPDLSLFPSISQSFSLWSLIFLLLLWWCGWWCFGSFCVVWWWVLCE